MRTVLAALGVFFAAATLDADPLNCNLSGYKAMAGLTAAVSENMLTLAWDGERDEQLRLRLAIEQGTPTIREIAVRSKSGQWSTLGADLTPEYRVVSGLRRMTNQQMVPLRGLSVPLTSEIVDKYKWDAFWDAPLDLSAPVARGGRGGGGRGAGAPEGGRGGAPPAATPAPQGLGGGNPPPAQGVADQPGLPRKHEEIRRATATYHSTGCEVKSNGGRIEVTFPGVEIGKQFTGRLHTQSSRTAA